MRKHSPGPWRYEYDNDVGPRDEYFCEFFRVLDANGNEIGRFNLEEDARLACKASIAKAECKP